MSFLSNQITFPNLGNTCFLNAALEALFYLGCIQKSSLKTSSQGLLPKIQALFLPKNGDFHQSEPSLRKVIKFLEKEKKMTLGEEGDSDIILSYILEKITTEDKFLETVFSSTIAFTSDPCKCPNSNQESGEIESLIFNLSPEGPSLEKNLLTINESCSNCGFQQEIQHRFNRFPSILVITLDKTAGCYEKYGKFFKEKLEFEDFCEETTRKTCL